MSSPTGSGSIFPWHDCKMTQGSCPFSLTLQASLLEASGCKCANHEQGWDIPPEIMALYILGSQYNLSCISNHLPAFRFFRSSKGHGKVKMTGSRSLILYRLGLAHLNGPSISWFTTRGTQWQMSLATTNFVLETLDFLHIQTNHLLGHLHYNTYYWYVSKSTSPFLLQAYILTLKSSIHN